MNVFTVCYHFDLFVPGLNLDDRQLKRHRPFDVLAMVGDDDPGKEHSELRNQVFTPRISAPVR